MTRPKVTIVTPTYNQASYVDACIRSVLEQEYEEWEQVVVDDGSTDGTREVAESFRDPRIRYLPLPHRGLSALAESYNAALRVGTGDLVAILEGDDAWPKDKLALQVPLFADPGVVISWGRARLIDEAGRPRGERASVRAPEGSASFDTRAAFLHLSRVNFLTPSVTAMTRRRVLDRVGGFQQTGSSLLVDLPTWLHVTARERGAVRYLDRVLGLYRVYDRQTSQLYRARMAEEHIRIVLEAEREIEDAELREVGWDARTRSRALVSGMISSGSVSLGEGRYADAARSFGSAIARTRHPAEGIKAAIGLASVVVRRDLLEGAYSLRDRWKRG